MAVFRTGTSPLAADEMAAGLDPLDNCPSGHTLGPLRIGLGDGSPPQMGHSVAVAQAQGSGPTGMAMPAVCPNGHTFLARNLVAGPPGTRVTITRSKVGPCPSCGQMGDIVDGTYELRVTAKQVVTVLRRFGRDEVIGFRLALQQIQSAKTEDQAREAAQGLPEPLKRLVQPDAAGWRDNVNKILQIIGILLVIWYGQKAVEAASHPVPPAPATAPATQIPSSELAQIVQQAIRELEQADGTSQPSKKPSRNSRCYCGSGKKYKYCHGADSTDPS